jgi:hypothetical protein
MKDKVRSVLLLITIMMLGITYKVFTSAEIPNHQVLVDKINSR